MSTHSADHSSQYDAEQPVPAPAAAPEAQVQARATTVEAMEANADRVLAKDQRAILPAVGKAMADKGYFLCGGASLALYLGHRKTNDLDFIRSNDFATDDVEKSLTAASGQKVTLISDGQAGFRQAVFKVGGAKVEVTRMEVKAEDAVEVLGGTKIPSYNESVAMKMAAATYRSTKRDIVDVYYLLRAGHSAEDLIERTVNRYPGRPGLSRTQVAASLVGFEQKVSHRDADLVETIDQVPWSRMKETVQAAFARVRLPPT